MSVPDPRHVSLHRLLTDRLHTQIRGNRRGFNEAEVRTRVPYSPDEWNAVKASDPFLFRCLNELNEPNLGDARLYG